MDRNQAQPRRQARVGKRFERRAFVLAQKVEPLAGDIGPGVPISTLTTQSLQAAPRTAQSSQSMITR